MPAHHPAIAALPRIPIEQPAGFYVDCLGVRTNVEFVRNVGVDGPRVEGDRIVPPLPAFGEEYFEWTDVFEAAEEADSEFVMGELGAGYGRWLVRGAALARRRGLRFTGVAVEGEPTHFRWLHKHCAENEVGESQVELLWAAVHGEGGFIPFRIGQANATYGQGQKRFGSTPYPDAPARRKLRARFALGYPPPADPHERSDLWVPCVTLADTLGPYPRIDLLDMDVQHLELTVIRSGMALLDDRVRRIHIGTHSREIESGLRTLFEQHGWLCLHDYPCHASAETPYGLIEFSDGVQTWLNPRLDSGQPRRPELPPELGLPSEPSSGSLTTHVNALTQQVRSLQQRNAKLLEKNVALRAKLTELRMRYRRRKD